MNLKRLAGAVAVQLVLQQATGHLLSAWSGAGVWLSATLAQGLNIYSAYLSDSGERAGADTYDSLARLAWAWTIQLAIVAVASEYIGGGIGLLIWALATALQGLVIYYAYLLDRARERERRRVRKYYEKYERSMKDD